MEPEWGQEKPTALAWTFLAALAFGAQAFGRAWGWAKARILAKAWIWAKAWILGGVPALEGHKGPAMDSQLTAASKEAS
jgi:hypothetical protein